jgi:hypothetical protein
LNGRIGSTRAHGKDSVAHRSRRRLTTKVSSESAINGTAAGIGNEVALMVVAASFDAIFAADRDGRIVLWNPGAEHLRPSRRGRGRGSLDIIIPEQLRNAHWEGYARVMSGEPSR